MNQQFTAASIESNSINLGQKKVYDIPGNTSLIKYRKDIFAKKPLGIVICFDERNSNILDLAQSIAELSTMFDISKIKKIVLTNSNEFETSLLDSLKSIVSDSPDLLSKSKNFDFKSYFKNCMPSKCDFTGESLIEKSSEIRN